MIDKGLKRLDIGKIARGLDIPQQAVLKVGHIDMVDNTRAAVEGIRAIIEYDDESIRFNMGKKNVRFTGSGLCIKAFDADHAVIDGEIIRIEFDTQEVKL